MRVRIVTPAPAGSYSGNRITAERWSRILCDLGHRVTIEETYRRGPCDLLVALHARKSFPSISRFHRDHPDVPLVVALTGTDLYCDLPANPRARRALELASRLIVLSPRALTRIPRGLREKAQTILQSVTLPRALAGAGGSSAAVGAREPSAVSGGERRARQRRSTPLASAGRLDPTLVAGASLVTGGRGSGRRRRGPSVRHGGVHAGSGGSDRAGSAFEVCVLGHLRPVKDPFRAAIAARLLPATSSIRVLHVGAALTPAMASRACTEEKANPRYCWLGERSRTEALDILSRCRLLVLSSRVEGGANVLMESLALRIPVVSSRIPSSAGLLGQDYPGYFPFGNTRALAALLLRAERDATFYADLQRRCRRLAPLADPRLERRAWKSLLREIRPSARPARSRAIQRRP